MTPVGRRTKEWLAAAAVTLICAAATVAIVRYDARTKDAIEQELYVPHATHITPEALLLEQYIRINTTNPPGNETAGARFLADLLARGGVRSEIIESAPGRGNLYARIKGREPGSGLLLLNHIDVVPAIGHWTRPPFSGSVALNMIHGRGTIDMKGVAICEIEAFLKVAHSGRVPTHDLVFLAVADEERGGALGTEWLLEHRPDVFAGISFVLNEGGITEMQQERLSWCGIETGAKQTTSVTVRAPSQSALRAARIALEPYFDPRDPTRLLPGVRAYFSSVAKTRVETRETLFDIDRTLAIGKFWLISDIYRHLLVNSVRAFGAQRAADGSSTMEVYLFNLPDEQPDARLAWLASVIRPFGATIAKVEEKQGPAPISNVNTPLFATIQREIQRAYGPVPVGPLVLAFSTNDSRFLRARGITCYGFQPYRVDFFQSLGVHGPDERVRVDWFDSGVTLMENVVMSAAFGTP